MNTKHILPSIFIIIINLVSSSTLSSTVQVIDEPLFIICGLDKATTTNSSDNRVWMSDDNPTFSPPDLTTISSTATTYGQPPPFTSARLFRSSITYTFSLSPGPKFLRLYFTTSTPYNNILPSQFFLSLKANQFILLNNFSSFLNSPKTTYEFHLIVEKGFEKNLNLTFSSGNGANNSNYGFINAFEIVSIPEGLYFDPNITYKYVTNPDQGYTPQNNTALQTMYRLNVGGSIIDPPNDIGSMWRAWFYDAEYLGSFFGTHGGYKYLSKIKLNYTKIFPYVAPPLVYVTERVIGNHEPDFNVKHNLTWVFEVDSGFDYLMRLHFCEMFVEIIGYQMRVFDVYIGNLMAESSVDVWYLSGGLGVPIYRDYVIFVDDSDGGGGGGGGSGARNGTKVPLQLTLKPQDIGVVDVLLNGLEIFKLSEILGDNSYNLAVPNPPSAAPPKNITVTPGSNHRKLPLIIGGSVVGTILVSLFIIICLVAYKKRANKELLKRKNTESYTLNKDKWAPPALDSGSATSNVSSSLPSDLCRRFSLVQIRVATCDFDEKLIVGKGGFGNVYKGSIDGGATKVAIKRLNTTSKQGAREFQNEIEMLSRLRHVHLVSLIGYCEDLGEMILVYEYMPRGTLRDHLLYKKSERNDGEDDHSNTPLSWKQRLNICVGSARGLHYLHAGAKQLVIHRDVKSTNILLDDKWTAKVSDFGLSKMGPMHHESGTTHVSTAVKGSIGYLDPEYYRRQQLSEKSDVYSFGVVLFEVLCARPAMNANLPKEQVNLALWARKHYKNGTLHTIIDPNLTGQIAPECLRKFGEIAETCVRDRGSERPSMGDVVWGLEFALELQETAEKNNISGGNIDEILGNLGSFQLSGGVDDVLYDNSDTISVDNFTKSTNIEFGEKRLLDSKTTTSNSSDYRIDMKSGSVFSEIIDPQAR